jgi:hypothetical protein
MELGPGQPNLPSRRQLEALSAEALVQPRPLRNKDQAEACLAALWLYHDFLDESHTISQSIETPEGSYWHGILHRREPDAANAAYWFRRLGDHAVFTALAVEAKELGLALKTGRWDPFEFIDLCEKHRGTGMPEETLLRRVQQREWELLFEWCWRRAAGDD